MSDPVGGKGGTLPPPPVAHGLSGSGAAARLRQEGPNELVPDRGRMQWLVRLVRPLTDPMAVLLLLAGATYIAIGMRNDAIVTLAALGPIAAVNWVLEARAERTLEGLARLTAPVALVHRDGSYRQVPSREIVVGDVVAVMEGDVVPADGLLDGPATLTIDESALTGESLPVMRSATGDRVLLAGTTVLSGRCAMTVTATGRHTQYGTIGRLVASVRSPRTPLQKFVRSLVLRFGLVAVVFCTAVIGLELARGKGWGAAIIAGVSLAIAAVPEEFSMVYTLYLALGARRLAQHHALVRRLPGVETLGSTTVICCDKTGTMTLGRLDVAAIAAIGSSTTEADRTEAIAAGLPLDGDGLQLIEATVLACEPEPFDPLERAIVSYARSHEVDVDSLHSGVLLRDHPFDPDRKYLSHVWRHDDRVTVSAKGALEGILDVVCADTRTRAEAEASNEALAARGMRVIAIASGELVGGSAEDGRKREADESVLHFRGLIGFSDPLRPGVSEALRDCRNAGIRVVMITGDHPVTAHAVAEGLDLPHVLPTGDDAIATGADIDSADDAALAVLVRTVNVFARTRPEQKHRLVKALRGEGHVVAMTGDGINDAPALREADIGVAMGDRGTEVAREAATLVLLDDNFATIVTAVRDGRRIADNMRKAFAYLLAFHPPLLLGALIVPLVNRPLLLQPAHLVMLELILHPVVSLVFESEPADADVMRRPPRSAEQGLAGSGLLRAGLLGLTLSAAVVITYLLRVARHGDVNMARAEAFTVLLIGDTLLILVARAGTRSVWHTPLRGNRIVPAALLFMSVFVAATLGLPPLAHVLKLEPFPVSHWITVAGAAIAATLWWEPFKGRA